MAAAYLTLGPSDNAVTLQLLSVSTQTEALTTLKKIQAIADPDALEIYAVTVRGVDIVTGQPIVRTYRAAH
jgi:hypothetical protein